MLEKKIFQAFGLRNHSAAEKKTTGVCVQAVWKICFWPRTPRTIYICDTMRYITVTNMYILQSIMQLYMCIWLHIYIYIYPLRMCSQFIQVVWPIYTTHFRVRLPARIEASNLRWNNGRAMGPWRTKVTGRPNHQTSEVRSENIKTILIKHPEFHEAIHFFSQFSHSAFRAVAQPWRPVGAAVWISWMDKAPSMGKSWRTGINPVLWFNSG